MTTITEVYEKYKHFDKLFSDKTWLPETIQGRILFEMWDAIKNEVKESDLNGD